MTSTALPENEEALLPRYFVLLVTGGEGQEIVTQNPKAECFMTEREAINFAKESARQDKDDDAVYHLMQTTHLVRVKRNIRVSVARLSNKRKGRS